MWGRKACIVSNFLLTVALASLLCLSVAAQTNEFDILILNGRVLDGTGNPWIQYDIGIRADEIVAVGKLKSASARRIIDAQGLYVAPGFIDMHSHADRALVSEYIEARQAGSLVSQGVTTVTSGMDGMNVRWPFMEELAAYESKGTAVNVVPFVGHNTIRREVMGDDYEREVTPQEVARMQELLRQGLEDGGWGLAVGLEYRPGRFSSTQEIIDLAKVVAEYDGIYIAHPRSEETMPRWQLPSLGKGRPIDDLQALEETIKVARETGIRVVLTHVKARGRSTFGRSSIHIKVVDQAREEGLQVYFDQYPYETFGSYAVPVIPPWACVDPGVDVSGGNDSPVYQQEGILDRWRENLLRNWSDPETHDTLEEDIKWIVDHHGGPERVFVLDFPDKSYVGKTLADLAREQGKQYPQVVIDLARNGYDDFYGGVRLRGLGIHELDIENYIRQEYTATSSDNFVSGVKGVPRFEGQTGSHPRHFGTFVRKIARYVKDRKLISLPFAIRSSTGLSAQILGLRDRGLIREGYKADIVIFDLDRLRDRATIFDPHLRSEGIEYVLVNGEFTVDEEQLTGTLPGTVIRRGD